MVCSRSRVVSVLGRYIARPVLERLVDTDKSAPASTERRELTIFFSDIRGFTAWTERAEPDEVATRLNEYFAAMTPIIASYSAFGRAGASPTAGGALPPWVLWTGVAATVGLGALVARITQRALQEAGATAG